METAAHHAGMNARQLGLITDHLQRNYIDTGKIVGCQTVVARHGHVAYHSSLGMMDLERARPMADDAIFRIYSMTKPITSIALMQLYERGLFQLNDPVYRVIPSWRAQKVYVSGEGDAMQLAPPEQPMTFKHVLSHTAGLSYGATAHPADRVYRDQNVVREGCDLATFIERMAGVPLRFTPGTRWMYSYATDVCGHLVEALSGMPLDRYFQEHIFAPLGMTDTAFSTPRENASRLTANYGRGKNKTLRLLDDPQASDRFDKPLFLSGGGGLLGTTADYLRFCEMLRCGGTLSGERIIGSRTLALMHRNHLPGGRDLASLAMGAFSETAYEGVGFGLGFATSLGSVATASPGNRDYYWGGAASTIFWVDPDEDLIVIFMTQLMPSDTFNFRGQLRNIVYAAID